LFRTTDPFCDKDDAARNGAVTLIMFSHVGAQQNSASRGTMQSRLLNLGLFAAFYLKQSARHSYTGINAQACVLARSGRYVYESYAL
jgi:hypothetical protein